ncbi:MAG: Uma2 family endonuclease [Bryobacterales bacterium]|nr:Uma2 family endonuclease [Bryobacterales bacterium]
MARQTLVPIEEYLRTSYDPDVDYVDGALEVRNLGEFEHALLQAKITAWLDAQCLSKRLFAVTEARVQVAPSRFRVPDICLTRGWPKGGVITEPPLLCIEILSPEDRLGRVEARIRDFLDFLVPAVWVIDAVQRRAWSYTKAGVEEAAGLTLTAGEVSLPLQTIFASIDSMR